MDSVTDRKSWDQKPKFRKKTRAREINRQRLNNWKTEDRNQA